MRSVSSDVIVSPSPAHRDPYREWPHDAQPRDIEDFEPSPLTILTPRSVNPKPVEKPADPTPKPTGPPSEHAIVADSIKKSEKFDKYYYK